MVTLDERDVVVGHSHSAPATTGDGLDHDRVTDFFGGGQGVLLVLDQSVRTRRSGHTSLFGQCAAHGLVFQSVHGPGIRPYEPYVATFTDVREVRIFGKETVTGMDCIHIRDFSGADHTVDSQITLCAGGFTDTDRLICNLNMHGIGIGVRIDGHRFDVKFLASPDDTDGDFTTIGDEDFFKHGLRRRACARISLGSGGTNLENRLAELNRFGVINQNLGDDSFDLCFDFVHDLHRLNDAYNGIHVHLGAYFHVVG